MSKLSLKNEFYKQALLKQIEECSLFMRNSPELISISKQMLELPGNDPSRDSKAILFRWAVQCIINRLTNSQDQPPVPLDFSSCHPALKDTSELLKLAKDDDPSVLMDLVENFRYEFFKTLKTLKYTVAIDFCKSTSKNLHIPIYMIGRFISSFKVSIAPFNYTLLFSSRCQDVSTMCDLYQGLLCDIGSYQVESAELLSNYCDPYLNEPALLLGNQAIRIPCHWVDASGSLCKKLFPSFSVLIFLFQVGTMNGNEMMKQLRKLPVTPITTKFKNQIILSQLLGLGDDWEPLKEKSIPAIISPDYITEGVLTLPRDTEFISIPKYSWETDFDFIEGYLAIIAALEKGTDDIDEFPMNVMEDLFSLLTIKDSNFEIPLNKTEKILHKLAEKVSQDDELSKYIEAGIRKVKAVRLVYQKPQKKQMFISRSSLFDICTDEKLPQLINIIGGSTISAISRLFKKSVVEKIGVPSEERVNYLFDPRYVHSEDENEIIEKVEELLKSIPQDKASYSLLDLALSRRSFTAAAKLCQDDSFNEILKKILAPRKTYPDVSNLTFCESATILQKKVLELNADLSSGTFFEFANYMDLLSHIGTSKYTMVKPENFVIKMIRKATTIPGLLEEFSKTNVDVISFIYKNIEASSLSKSILIDIVKNEPLSGLIYSHECLESSDVAMFYPQDIMKKYLSRSKNFSVFDSNIDGKDTFIKTGDLFYYNGEEKLDAYLPEVLQNVRKMDVDEAIAVLNELALQFDLEPYFTEVLEITKDFPGEKCKDLIETLAETFPSDSNALLLLYTRLDSYKQKKDVDEEKNWNYIIQIASDYTKCFENPERIYTYTQIHLSHYSYGRTLVENIQNFVKILIIVRSKHFFKTREEEYKWIRRSICPGTETVAEAFSRLNDEMIVTMIVDIAINNEVECMKRIASKFDSNLLASKINPYLLKSPQIAELLPDVKQRDAALNTVLKRLVVRTQFMDARLLQILAKFKKYISEDSRGLLDVLRDASVNGLFSRFEIQFSARSLESLLQYCIKYDIHKARDILIKMGTKFNPTKLNDELTIFGITPSKRGTDSKIVYTSPPLPFDTDSLVSDLKEPNSILSSSIRIASLGNNIALYGRAPCPLEIHKPKICDFEYLDIKSPIADLRTSGNIYSNINFAKSNGEISFNDEDILNILTSSISYTELPELFDSILKQNKLDLLKRFLEIFDEHSCLFALLTLASWALQNKEALSIFSGEKNLTGKELENFVITVKDTLSAASAIYESVDPTILLPPGSIIKNNGKVLKDTLVIINYQKEVLLTQSKRITLLSTADKGNAVTQLLILSDYDRAFTLMRELGVDPGDVMIEAAGYYGQRSNVELCEFLVNVIPRMDVDSANQLIEALASILVGNKFDDLFIKGIIAGMEEPRNAFHILKWFGLTDTAALIALQNGLNEEIEVALKDSKLKKGVAMIKACTCWLSRNHHTNQMF